MSLLISLVAVISTDGFISRKTGVPWDLPVDKAHYRSYTRGKWLLVGRRTYEEKLGWFEDRHPLVLNADPSYRPAIGQRVGSMAEALELAKAAGVPELVVVGGAGVFAAAMPVANRLVITHVADSLGSGVPFPRIDPQQWHPTARIPHAKDGQHAHDFEIVFYERVASEG